MPATLRVRFDDWDEQLVDLDGIRLLPDGFGIHFPTSVVTPDAPAGVVGTKVKARVAASRIPTLFW